MPIKIPHLGLFGVGICGAHDVSLFGKSRQHLTSCKTDPPSLRILSLSSQILNDRPSKVCRVVAAGAKGPASPLELRGLWLQSTPTCVSLPWSGPGLAFVRISELGVEYKKPHAH